MKLPITMRLLGWQGLLVHARRVRKVFQIWRKKAHSHFRLAHVRQTYVGWNSAVEAKPLIERVCENENYFYRIIQAEYFEAELRALRDAGQVKRQSRIAMLFPHLNGDQILRAYERVTTLFENCNNTPVILDSKHPAVKLVVESYHRN